MKNILILSVLAIAVLMAPGAAKAQHATTPYPVSEYFAADYAQWKMNSQSNQNNNFTFLGRYTCAQQAPAGAFNAFAINAPVLIVDAVSANTERVTPTAIIQSGSNCGFSAAPTHPHLSYVVKSGTAGLQEALNAAGAGMPSHTVAIVLDRNWWATALQVPGTNPAAIITAAKGNANIVLKDITTANGTPTAYTWQTDHYATAP